MPENSDQLASFPISSNARKIHDSIILSITLERYADTFHGEATCKY